MKQFLLALLVIDALLHTACSTVSHDSPTTDYALMAAVPYNVETARARERLDKFLAHADARKRTLLAQTPYVAVLAATVTAADAYPILRRAGRGEIGDAPSPGERMDTPVYFLLVFDSRTRQMVGDDGVLAVQTPRRGSVGTFGGNTALYIGEGW
jgi:hypothetical protein